MSIQKYNAILVDWKRFWIKKELQISCKKHLLLDPEMLKGIKRITGSKFLMKGELYLGGLNVHYVKPFIGKLYVIPGK